MCGQSPAGPAGSTPQLLQHRRPPRQSPDRDRRPHGRGDRRTAPRSGARGSLAADHRRRAPLRRFPGQDRPGTACHPPDAPIRFPRTARLRPAQLSPLPRRRYGDTARDQCANSADHGDSHIRRRTRPGRPERVTSQARPTPLPGTKCPVPCPPWRARLIVRRTREGMNLPGSLRRSPSALQWIVIR
jgi:hypothetical protein